MAELDPLLSKRLRPFRAVAWVVYVVFAVGFSLLITVSVIRSVLSMSPPHASSGPVVLGPAECVTRATALWNELEAARTSLGAQPRVSQAEAHWATFRVDWLVRHRAAEAQCAVNQVGREGLKRAFARLETVMDLYTTHATQFSGEVGPAVDELKAALAEAAASPR